MCTDNTYTEQSRERMGQVRRVACRLQPRAGRESVCKAGGMPKKQRR